MATPDTIKVGMLASLTGQFHTQGRQALAGIQTWAWDVNQAGGIYIAEQARRLPVSLIHYDDASHTGAAQEATRRLINLDGVDLLIGPYSSVLSRAAAAIAEEQGKLIWNQGGAADNIHQQGWQWVIAVLTPASQYLSALPQLVRQYNPDANSLAILRVTPGAFPRLVSQGMQEQAESLAFTTNLVREFEPDTTDYSAILNEIRRFSPHLLLVVGQIYNDIALAQQLARLRLPLGAVAVVAAGIQQFQDALGADAEGFTGPSQWEPGESCPVDYGPTTQQVIASLGQQGKRVVDYPLVQSYAAGLVMQRCIKEARRLDNAALRQVAGTLDFTTFYGRFKIDPVTGQQVGRSGVIVQWQGGKKVVVWPAEQAQASLSYPWRNGHQDSDPVVKPNTRRRKDAAGK